LTWPRPLVAIQLAGVANGERGGGGGRSRHRQVPVIGVATAGKAGQLSRASLGLGGNAGVPVVTKRVAGATARIGSFVAVDVILAGR
jgi:hypothetical protein